MPNKDFCIVDNKSFYIRGRFLIPIIREERGDDGGVSGGGGPKEELEKQNFEIVPISTISIWVGLKIMGTYV